MILGLISKKEEQVKSLNIGDKVGYALGDFGCVAFFAFVSSYLVVFYTDVLGINTAAAGTLFAVARMWDAINDPITGASVDKVGTSKHGKLKPYVVKSGLPMVIVGILASIATLGLPEAMKLPYAYITYILFGMLHTAVNIPYGSLASVVGNDPNERTALSMFKNIGSMGVNFLVIFFVPKTIFNAQGVVTAEGFMICTVALAVISLILLLLNFRLTRERTVHQASKSKKSMEETLKGLAKNRAFTGVALTSFTMVIGTLTVNTLNAYLFKDYFKAPNLTAFGRMVGTLVSFVVTPFTGTTVKEIGKKETAVLGAIIPTVIYVGMLFIPNLAALLYIVLSSVAGSGSGLINTIIWVLAGDAIDYQEYTTGERNEGTVYSLYSLVRELAQAISGDIGGFALFTFGYQPGSVEQSVSVGLGIRNIAIGGAAIGYVATALILVFIYNLSKKKVEGMNKELEERRLA